MWQATWTATVARRTDAGLPAAIVAVGAATVEAWLDARAWQRALCVAAALALLFVLATAACVSPPPALLPDDPRAPAGIERVHFTDRSGVALNETRLNAWNLHERVELHAVPSLLIDAIVLAEDQRYWENRGADWLARAHAVQQAVTARRVVRGASTLGEQVARMLTPRPRTPWSRWLEGWEAGWLEARHGKAALLEFYLNQVPYAAQRRGVLAASRHHFGRDLGTLNAHEILTLAVLIRAPSGIDVGGARATRAVRRLAARLRAAGIALPTDEDLLRQPLSRPMRTVAPAGDASAFLSALRAWPALPAGASQRTTLDGALQARVQQLLASQLRQDADLEVRHAAALVVDWRTDEILAWVVVSGPGEPPTTIDAVRVRRQPGSTLKPFVYAAAFEKGWTPSTMILDAPLEQRVGSGLHEYHNYSRLHYGWISAREALGNSLNVPAVKAVQFVGTPAFLARLRAAGIDSLRGHPNVYGDGIALGNGEVTLYELVSAYATLARGGVYRPFTPFSLAAGDVPPARTSRRAFRAETASLVADILSDDSAREREFGAHGVLDFPLQTAVKTGTSSDYRDAWTVAFNDCCVVGAWFGNLDYRPMREISGARGPAPAVRNIVAAINRGRDSRALARHPALRLQRVCVDTGRPADAGCEARDDWFAPWMTPGNWTDGDTRVRIRRPGAGLRLAMDPRIADASEGFEFLVQAPQPVARTRWSVDGAVVGETAGERFVWLLHRGEHRVAATVWLAGRDTPVQTEAVPFTVR